MDAKLGRTPSYTWRSIVAAKELLQDGGIWRIGNGNDVSVWQQRWLPQRRYGRLYGPPNANQLMWKVADFIDTELGGWDVAKLHENFIPADVADILRIRLPYLPSKDVFSWQGEKNGVYSVKSGYRKLNTLMELSMERKRVWRSIWQCKVPPKIRHYGWRVWHGILPTRDGLRRRGIAVEEECPVCRQAPESIDHVLLTCPWAKLVWQKTEFKIDPVTMIPGDQARILIEGVISGVIEGDLEGLLMTMWAIWNNRNQAVFESKISRAEDVVMRTKAHLNQYREACQRREPTKRRPSGGWQVPHAGQVKLNCDGTFIQGTHGGGGAVIRDAEGVILGAMSGAIENCSSVEEAEAWAIWQGLILVQKMGYRKVQVESDSSRVIAEITKAADSHALFGDVVHNIRFLIPWFEFCSFKHIRRDCNRVADFFASLSRGNPSLRSWVLELPLGVADVIP